MPALNCLSKHLNFFRLNFPIVAVNKQHPPFPLRKYIYSISQTGMSNFFWLFVCVARNPHEINNACCRILKPIIFDRTVPDLTTLYYATCTTRVRQICERNGYLAVYSVVSAPREDLILEWGRAR